MIVVWRVTTRCNLSCPFCAYDRRLPFPRKTADPSQINTFLKVLSEYQDKRQDPVLVSWIGGEPMLWPELPRLTENATSLGLRISATTNGTTLQNESVRCHILDHYAELTVSLDAPDNRHGLLRSSPGLFDSLNNSVSAISREREATSRPLKLRVNTVLLRSTIGDFSGLARQVAQWGADELTYNILGGRDRPEYYPSHRPLPAQLEHFIGQLPALRADLLPRGLTIAGSSAYLDRLHSAASGFARPVKDCGHGERFLFIDEHGFVSPCSFTSDTVSMPISELRDDTDIAALADRFASARCKQRPGVCDDCPSTHVFDKFSPSAA